MTVRPKLVVAYLAAAVAFGVGTTLTFLVHQDRALGFALYACGLVAMNVVVVARRIDRLRDESHGTGGSSRRSLRRSRADEAHMGTLSRWRSWRKTALRS